MNPFGLVTVACYVSNKTPLWCQYLLQMCAHEKHVVCRNTIRRSNLILPAKLNPISENFIVKVGFGLRVRK